MSTRRKQPGGWVKAVHLPKGPNGHALCRRCGQEVEPPRRTFCSDACVHEWRVRTDANYLREKVFRRDKGVCAICKTNTMRLSSAIRKLNFRGRKTRCAALGIPLHRLKSMWDADHIIPVAEGGGECDLANIRTLCIPCHRRQTEELMKRLKEHRQSEQNDGILTQFAGARSPVSAPQS